MPAYVCPVHGLYVEVDDGVVTERCAGCVMEAAAATAIIEQNGRRRLTREEAVTK
jgi:hypothetical protein